MQLRVIAIALCTLAAVARAQPQQDSSATLRAANGYATAGDWPRVATLVGPLFGPQLEPPLDRADQAEAHRLYGLAMYFAGQTDAAEQHFLDYLRIDLDGHLDPTLYPPEVVYFFDDVRARHAAELRARRPRPRRYWVLNFVPPLGQFQNGDRTKGWITAGALGSFAIANVGSYFLLKSWCTRVTSPTNSASSIVCDEGGNHPHASTLRTVNLVSGIGILATYVWGVYDGVRNYGRRDRKPSYAPYAMTTKTGFLVGVGAEW